MPELPEVETVAADLRDQLIGLRFTGAQVNWPRTLAHPGPESLSTGISGREVTSISRRGKYLLIGLDNDFTLIIHLRMTGRLAVVPEGDPALCAAHVRALFGLDGGRYLVFSDARKFGRIWLVNDPAGVVGKLGPEPLAWDFTAADLAGRLKGRRTAIKALLLDQTVVAGVGNIYADEALFLARIHPRRSGASLREEEIDRLHDALRAVLDEAIGQRGTMLRDYRTPYGPDGAYQERLRVYRQTGLPCPRCGAPIERIRLTQRSTHFCPRCQEAGR